MVLYLYSTFLVLMTTQSSLQYSFTFTQSHTHSYSRSISSTVLFYEGNSGFSILPKDTSAYRFERLGIKLLTFRLEDDHSTPQPQPQIKLNSGNTSALMSEVVHINISVICSHFKMASSGCHSHNVRLNDWLI